MSTRLNTKRLLNNFMTTKELIEKYQKVIASLINTDPKYIIFQVLKDGEWIEIGSIDYVKDETGNEIHNFCQGIYGVVDLSNRHLISSFKLYELPHCCAFLVSCNSYVSDQYRNRGVATALNLMRQDIGRILGYSAMLCTDIEQNSYQRKVLNKNGWKDIFDVVNKRTGNHVFLSVINL